MAQLAVARLDSSVHQHEHVASRAELPPAVPVVKPASLAPVLALAVDHGSSS